MFKLTKIYYPHIVKKYTSFEDFIAENGYGEYYTASHEDLAAIGIDKNDATRYHESLSDDGFEATVTIVFDSEDHRNQLNDLLMDNDPTLRCPIFEEESDVHPI